MAERTQKIQKYKTDAVNQLKGMIEEAKDLIFTDYRGLNVAQMAELRKRLRAEDAGYRVVKNNFAEIAIAELGLPYEKEFLIDPTALAFVRKDSGPVARALFDFARNSPLRVKGAVIEGKMMAAAEVEALSRFPSRVQLYAMLMRTMTAPVTNLLFALNGVVTRLVRTLQAVADAKAGGANSE